MQFKRAIRENIKALVGFTGGEGSGKTWSALRFAGGLSDGQPFALLDSENGRALHYADDFSFHHQRLESPFSPTSYAEAVEALARDFPVVIVDSMSHEWNGVGGVLEMQETELNSMAGSDADKRKRLNQLSWVKPKTAHKAMVQRFLQLSAHLILCFRGKQPNMENARHKSASDATGHGLVATGRDGWFPICEAEFPYEFLVHLLFTRSAPGVPKPIKIYGIHEPYFPPNEQVSEESGKRLAEWAAGGKAKPEAKLTETPTENRAGSWFDSYKKGFHACTSIPQLRALGEDCKKEGLDHVNQHEMVLLREVYKKREQELELAGSCEPV